MGFESGGDYEVALLRFVAKAPNHQGDAGEICETFEREYHDHIPAEQHEVLESGSERWHKNLKWARYKLTQKRLLDSPERGVWRITQAGLDWVRQNPTATRITGKEGRRQRARGVLIRTVEKPVAGISLEMLEQTRKSMPADQFRQVWGQIYDHLAAEERAKAVTEVTQTELGHRTRYRLDEIHNFLQGRSASSPSSEVLCDWIHFCYALELYREAAALLPYVHEEEVEPAVYRRAKRIAVSCRNKEG
jgi:restriction endonuclease Mrr